MKFLFTFQLFFQVVLLIVKFPGIFLVSPETELHNSYSEIAPCALADAYQVMYFSNQQKNYWEFKLVYKSKINIKIKCECFYKV